MYVCLCHGVTEHQVRQAAAEGCDSLHELTARTGVASGCGSCASTASEILAEVNRDRAFVLPLLIAA